MPRARSRIDPAELAAAFAPDGLHGVSASELARHAGVAKPTLYAHGGSKDAVFLACVEAEVERLLQRLHGADAATAGHDLERRATALSAALLAHAASHPAAFRLLHRTAEHRSSTVAGAVDRALARIPQRLDAALGHAREGAGTALWGAAGALAAAVTDRNAAAALLGRGIAAACAPAATPADAGPGSGFGIY
jgi:AcrR family transcriptional regulator